MKNVAQAQREVDFGLEELFFSRTDASSAILSGNSVFLRISGYEWADMNKAPHKIVRHPDMPRAVFSIFWDRLKKGEPVGAYVKNRDKDGGYYWVYAMVTPISGGYLSVRTKPTTQLFQEITELYAEIREREKSERLEPEASANLMMERLADMGFRNYLDFMCQSVVQETESRDALLDRSDRIDTAALHALIETSKDMLNKASEVGRDFNRVRSFPINLRIQASKLHGLGPLFSAISSDYARFCGEIESVMAGFMDASTSVCDQLADAVFRLCTSRFQEEMAKNFSTEASNDDTGALTQEIELLKSQAKEFGASTSTALGKAKEGAVSFDHTSNAVNRLVGGLDVVRILGMTEASRLGEECEIIRKMMGEAENFQGQILARLASLKTMNNAVLQHTEQITQRVGNHNGVKNTDSFEYALSA